MVETVASPVALTETVLECPLCGDQAVEPLFPAHDRLYHLPGAFALVRCEACQLVRLSPRPVKGRLKDYYPEDDYYSYRSPTVSIETISTRGRLAWIRDGIRDCVLSSRGYTTSPLKAWQRILRPIFVSCFLRPALYGWGTRFPNYVPGGRALDVGCGNGYYLSYLKHHGWEVKGVDFSATAADVARHQFGIDVFAGELQDAPFELESFDFINMSHIIEHVADPLRMLRHTASLLKPGGILYIETPNVGSFGSKRCGRYWYAWESPRHLVMFSPATLEKAIAGAGLRVQRMWSIVYNLFDWEETYKKEEQERRKLDVRPQVRPEAKPRVALLSGAAHLARLFDPLSGDFLCCFAIKEKS